jgi:hypothetical protein
MPIHATDYEDPAYWLSRAEEVRVIAETMRSPEAKHSMLGMAEMYTRIAQRIQKLRSGG